MKSAATFQRRMQVSCVSPPPGKVRLRRGRAASRPGVSGTAPSESAGAEGPAPHRRQTARYHGNQHTVLLTDGQRREKKNGALTENGEPPDFRCKVTFYAKRNVTSITGSQL